MRLPDGEPPDGEPPAGTRLLLVEGVGAARREVSALLDAAAWVQSDVDLARERGIARDVASGVNGDEAGVEAFWDGWDREEVPFQAGQQPWERARLVVAGTGDAVAPGTFPVSAGPLPG